MNARRKLFLLANKSNVSVKFVMEMFDVIIEAVKEECCSGNFCFPKPPKFMNCPYSVKPTFTEIPTYCGYTEEQWQLIFAGEFLCEFSAEDGKPQSIGRLYDFDKERECPFGGRTSKWSKCKPVRRKGVARPIFVQPSNLNAECIFITDRKETKQTKYMYYANFKEMFPATSYIEL